MANDEVTCLRKTGRDSRNPKKRHHTSTLNMNTIKKITTGLLVCLAFLFFNAADVKAQTSGYYQYYEGPYSSDQHFFNFGDDANTCPSYKLDAYDVYIEGENDYYGGTCYSLSLVSGSPTSYFNYGGFGMLHLEPYEYAILKADFNTPNGTVSKYIYFYNF